jgi:tRNA pseudouridine55 synthase
VNPVRPSLSGVLVVDKPAGPTSFDVVNRLRRAARAKKAGHAGTLDPAATGVLVVCLEDAVRVQQYLSDGDKAYRATVSFGAATDTEDAEGKVVEEGDPAGMTAEALRAALARFVGEIDQVPPMFSAVRVGGRRLHEAARAGEAVERAPRRVRIDALELVELGPWPADPERSGPQGRGVEGRKAILDVRCGKGTYVRTLAADLGRALGVPAHLAALRRTAASGFALAQAAPLEELERLAREVGPEALRPRLIPLAQALPLPEARVSPREAGDLAHGRSIPGGPHSAGLVRAVDGEGRLVAVCEASDGRLKPSRVFLTPAELQGPKTP